MYLKRLEGVTWSGNVWLEFVVSGISIGDKSCTGDEGTDAAKATAFVRCSARIEAAMQMIILHRMHQFCPNDRCWV